MIMKELRNYTDIGKVETPEQLCEYLKNLYGVGVDSKNVTDVEGMLHLFLFIDLRGWKRFRYENSPRYRHTLTTGILYTCRSVKHLADPSMVVINLTYEL